MSKGSAGLFLGAGASFEVGMPLVTDVTAELSQLLNPAKLRSLNATWRANGNGHPDAVIDDLSAFVSMPDLHYEAWLGHLEAQFRRHHHAHQQAYYGLYSWAVESVYWVLFLRHVQNAVAIDHRLKFLDGLAALASASRPFWIFSLNHDLIIECIAARHDIPLSAGFGPDRIVLPRRDRNGAKIGEIHAEVLPGAHFEKTGMAFLPPGATGINLVKIHGALDVFTHNDGNDLLRLLPDERSTSGIIETLRRANEELICVDSPLLPPWKVTNEIAYADEQGESQFLRRSLLAGAFKYDKRVSQALPFRLLAYFKAYLNYVQTLVCVGYGFGDSHINVIIRECAGVQCRSNYRNRRAIGRADPRRISSPRATGMLLAA